MKSTDNKIHSAPIFWPKINEASGRWALYSSAEISVLEHCQLFVLRNHHSFHLCSLLLFSEISKRRFRRRAIPLTDLLADFTVFSMVGSEGNHQVHEPAFSCVPHSPETGPRKQSPRSCIAGQPQPGENCQIFARTFLVTDSRKSVNSATQTFILYLFMCHYARH